VPPLDSDEIKKKLLQSLESEKIYNPPALGWDKISDQYLKVVSLRQ